MGTHSDDTSDSTSQAPTSSTADASDYAQRADGLSEAELVALNDPSDAPSALAFRMIALAGEARALAARAVDSSAQDAFVDAESLLDEARESYDRARRVQTALTAAHTHAGQPAVDLLLVHAHDHLAMAKMAIDNAEIFVRLYRRIARLEAQPRIGED
ncbi:PTS lactose/cellobiose transporter subunit IIA [Propionibacterium freudenreichii]|uniref:PTS lactose/cellobiose transporter subunit IIA n=1 Tax=Propionibacterium freudenreichii TaxID=1744 RepID=UPI000543BFF5|nr:PTS lactose/cellobiose transporter subunit IIA [Propionibacterium freudenreichii]MDK9643811.1 PTS lactose/cellobiose transporter subunit IIA [Propionibacterium freudenreichii]CEG87387.1 Hypothetical protein PFCIRM118_01785 [Propionibacterium freudenreichii]CEH01155.1 Hypothetical protein PFCIRM127_01685 [Propionibacterium freudenreichii]CEI26974.1 Hypothetical protein PFCIRM508_08425 [Propionibacterium freudenreichii]